MQIGRMCGIMLLFREIMPHDPSRFVGYNLSNSASVRQYRGGFVI
nr:MAG TPA: hypothetical protein [Caudoviricetes sp.]